MRNPAEVVSSTRWLYSREPIKSNWKSVAPVPRPSPAVGNFAMTRRAPAYPSPVPGDSRLNLAPTVTSLNPVFQPLLIR